jgi:threonine dehydrogenase-like Zn-dependent dehydrogenase
MRAALYQAAGVVTVDDVPDAAIAEPTDAVVQVLRSCICGSDLWSYRGIVTRAAGGRQGHEFLGVVTDVGAEVTSVRPGDLVVAPFTWSDNTCPACAEGLQSKCDNGGTFGAPAPTAARARRCGCRRPTARWSSSPAGSTAWTTPG